MAGPRNIAGFGCCESEGPPTTLLLLIVVSCCPAGGITAVVTAPGGGTTTYTFAGYLPIPIYASGTYSIAISCAGSYGQTISVDMTLGTGQEKVVYLCPSAFPVTVNFSCGTAASGAGSAPYGDTTVTVSGEISGSITVPAADSSYPEGATITAMVPIAEATLTGLSAVTVEVGSPRFLTQAVTLDPVINTEFGPQYDVPVCSASLVLPIDPDYQCCGCPSPTEFTYQVAAPFGTFTITNYSSYTFSCVDYTLTWDWIVRFECQSFPALGPGLYAPQLVLYGSVAGSGGQIGQVASVDFGAGTTSDYLQYCSPYSWTGEVSGATCIEFGDDQFPCAPIACIAGEYAITEA